MNNSIIAVVVTYNRKDDLALNLDALYHQSYPLDMIVVVNNCSSDGTKDFLEKESKQRDNLKVINMKKNVGGAGGFYEGTRQAYLKNADYIWLMDDDGRPLDKYSLERLVLHTQEIKAENPLIMINSMVTYDSETMSFGLIDGLYTIEETLSQATNDIIPNRINPFNGTLVSSELVKKIGFPNKDFFIKGDEFDYMCRAQSVGAYIATVCTSRFFHPKVVMETKKILGKTLICHIEAPWKEYYRARNYTYMYKNNSNYFKCFKSFIQRSLDALLLAHKKTETIKMIYKGFLDGIRENMGATVTPR